MKSPLALTLALTLTLLSPAHPSPPPATMNFTHGALQLLLGFAGWAKARPSSSWAPDIVPLSASRSTRTRTSSGLTMGSVPHPTMTREDCFASPCRD